MQQKTHTPIAVKTLTSADSFNSKNDHNNLHHAGFCRLWHIIGNPKANPPIPALIPIGRTTFLNGVKSGKYPKPVKLGERTIAWRRSDIIALIGQLGGAS